MTNYTVLQRLSSTVSAALPESFYRGVAADIPDEYISTFPRTISLAGLNIAVEETMQRFMTQRKQGGRDWQAASDAYLADRLYAAIPLTRAEAADSEIWNFLAIGAFPDYVFWRWTDRKGKVAPVHFIGPDNKHAFKRLWWGVELSRNGRDTSLAQVAFSMTDIPNTILSLDAIHNRAVAIAVLRYISQNGLNSDEINTLSTKLNTSAVTVSLDTIAPNPRAPEIDEAWLLGRSQDRTRVPDTDKVPDEDVQKVLMLLESLNVLSDRERATS